MLSGFIFGVAVGVAGYHFYPTVWAWVKSKAGY